MWESCPRLLMKHSWNDSGQAITHTCTLGKLSKRICMRFQRTLIGTTVLESINSLVCRGDRSWSSWEALGRGMSARSMQNFSIPTPQFNTALSTGVNKGCKSASTTKSCKEAVSCMLLWEPSRNTINSCIHGFLPRSSVSNKASIAVRQPQR